MKKKILLSCLALLPLLSFAQKKRVSILANSGHAWRLGKLPELSNIIPGTGEKFRDHLKKVRNGFNLDAAAYYHITPGVGLGVKYHRYESTKLSDVDYWGSTTKGFSQDVINYYGVGFLLSNFGNENKHKFYFDGTIGYMTYNSDSRFGRSNPIDMNVKWKNIALAGSVAYMYAFSPTIYVGPVITGTAGIEDKFEVNGVETQLDGKKESLFSISANLGATIRF